MLSIDEAIQKENEKVRVTVWTGIEKIGFMQYGKWFVYSSEGVAEATVVAWQPTELFKERDSMNDRYLF